MWTEPPLVLAPTCSSLGAINILPTPRFSPSTLPILRAIMVSASTCRSITVSMEEKLTLQLWPSNMHPRKDDGTFNPLPTKEVIGDGWGSVKGSAPLEMGGNNPPRERSTVKLSQQSLDICTEVLGSETGVYGFLQDDFTTVAAVEEDLTRVVVGGGGGGGGGGHGGERRRYQHLPPPLSTMAGGHGAIVRESRRTEKGRLVLVSTLHQRANFFLLSQRTDAVDGGRLCIRYFPNSGGRLALGCRVEHVVAERCMCGRSSAAAVRCH